MRHHLRDWVLEAVAEAGGKASVVDVAKIVWRRHEGDLRQAGDLFYPWQYATRWEAQKLRDEAKLTEGQDRTWALARE